MNSINVNQSENLEEFSHESHTLSLTTVGQEKENYEEFADVVNFRGIFPWGLR